MNRELITEIGRELVKIDKLFDKFGEKYGTFFCDGNEYICTEAEEPYMLDSGKKIYVGGAFRRDEIEIHEECEEADGMDQIAIEATVFYYEKDSDGVYKIGVEGQLRWKGNYFGI